MRDRRQTHPSLAQAAASLLLAFVVEAREKKDDDKRDKAIIKIEAIDAESHRLRIVFILVFAFCLGPKGTRAQSSSVSLMCSRMGLPRREREKERQKRERTLLFCCSVLCVSTLWKKKKNSLSISLSLSSSLSLPGGQNNEIKRTS